jgi:hypothetical protein
MKSIFFSAITVAGKSIGAGCVKNSSIIEKINSRNITKNLKCSMFTKAGNIVGKKSGELIITKTFTSEKTAITLRLNGLDLPKSNVTLNNYSFMQKSSLSYFNKFSIKNINYIVPKDCKYYRYNLPLYFNQIKKTCINKHASGEIDNNHMLNYITCMNSLKRAIGSHTVVIETRNISKDSVIYSYFVISTTKKAVLITLAPEHREKKILLYTDPKTEKKYYTTKVIYEDIVPNEEFESILEFKNQEDQ